MATFRAGEESNYGGTGGSGFFKIGNDKETKRVRFLYRGVDDVAGMSVHKIELGGSNRYVNCIREYNEPIDNCPFCKAKYPVQARVFIPIYNEDEGEVQLWDRGAKTWIGRMTSLCARYASTDKQLVSSLFDIERNGKPKDMKTDYNLYYVQSDDKRIEDFPEPKKALGGLVLDKSAQDMEYFLEHNDFPKTMQSGNSGADEAPIRRRNAERRTPETTNREEVF